MTQELEFEIKHLLARNDLVPEAAALVQLALTGGPLPTLSELQARASEIALCNAEHERTLAKLCPLIPDTPTP